MSAPITHGPTGLINWKARAKAAEKRNVEYGRICDRYDAKLKAAESKLARLAAIVVDAPITKA